MHKVNKNPNPSMLNDAAGTVNANNKLTPNAAVNDQLNMLIHLFIILHPNLHQ